MVRKNSEFSYTLAKLFNKCLKESCVPDRWNVSMVVSVFKNVRERSTAKIYRSVGLLSVVSKAFEKLVNNRISVQMLDLISSFLINRQFQVVLDGKSSQEYSVNAGVTEGFILGLTLPTSYYTSMSFLMMLSVIVLSILMALLSTLSVIRNLICGNN